MGAWKPNYKAFHIVSFTANSVSQYHLRRDKPLSSSRVAAAHGAKLEKGVLGQQGLGCPAYSYTNIWHTHLGVVNPTFHMDRWDDWPVFMSRSLFVCIAAITIYNRCIYRFAKNMRGPLVPGMFVTYPALRGAAYFTQCDIYAANIFNASIWTLKHSLSPFSLPSPWLALLQVGVYKFRVSNPVQPIHR